MQMQMQKHVRQTIPSADYFAAAHAYFPQLCALDIDTLTFTLDPFLQRHMTQLTCLTLRVAIADLCLRRQLSFPRLKALVVPDGYINMNLLSSTRQLLLQSIESVAAWCVLLTYRILRVCFFSDITHVTALRLSRLSL